MEDRYKVAPIVPSDEQRGQLQEIALKGNKLAEAIATRTPDGREQSIALTKLDEAIQWAGKAIAG